VTDWKKIFKMFAETDEHKAKVQKAQNIIRKALHTSKKPYIAYSGGKDSTCVLQLVLQQKPDIMVLHWDYGRYYIPRPLAQELVDNAIEIGAKNIRIETSAKYEELKRNAVNVLGEDFLGKLLPRLKQEGYDLCFLGLRAQESVKRKRKLKTRGVFWKESGFLNCAPIANWTWQDVWAYIFGNNLPYASVYDLYVPVVGWDKVRLTTFFDPEFEKLGNRNVDSALMWRFKGGLEQ